MLLKTATGYVQQSPWLSIANKQLELMGRFMAELGMTPASRSRVAALLECPPEDKIDRIERIIITIGGDEPRPGHILADSDSDAGAAIARID